MDQETFTVKAPQIVVQSCNGLLTIRATAEKRIVLRGLAAMTADDPVANTITIAAPEAERLELWVPAQSQLLIEECSGLLQIKGIEGHVEVKRAADAVALRTLGNVRLGTVAGDISARDIDGRLELDHGEHDMGVRNVNDLVVHRVDGDFGGRNVRGAITLEKAGGDISLNTVLGAITVQTGERDLYLQNVSGLVKASDIRGDVRLRDGLAPGRHEISAAGDIIIHWPRQAPLNVDATAASVVQRLPLTNVVKSTANGKQVVNGRLGDGATFLRLVSGGEIILKPLYVVADGQGEVEVDFDFAADLAGIGEQMIDIGQQIVGEINLRLSDQIAAIKASFDAATKGGSEKREPAGEAADPMDSGVRKAEEAIRKVRRKAEEAIRRTQEGPAVKQPPPAAAPEGDSKAKLKVLEMLEQGKITIEEATMLLQNLK